MQTRLERWCLTLGPTPHELAMPEKTLPKCIKQTTSLQFFPLSLSLHLSQADVPTAIGVGPPTEVSMETDSGPVKQLEKKYYIDSTYITVPREGVEINTPLRDGLGEFYAVC